MRPMLHCLTILFNVPTGVSFTSPVFFKFHEDKNHVFQITFLEAEGAQGHPGMCFWSGVNRVSLFQEDTEKAVPWETVSRDGTYFHQNWTCHPTCHSPQEMGKMGLNGIKSQKWGVQQIWQIIHFKNDRVAPWLRSWVRKKILMEKLVQFKWGLEFS